jgi:hypothetical protein
MVFILSFRRRRNHNYCSRNVISPAGRNDKRAKFHSLEIGWLNKLTII